MQLRAAIFGGQSRIARSVMAIPNNFRFLRIG